MPNWCKNNLRIKANGEKVLEILELLKDKDGEFTMNKAVPMPKELEDTTAPTPEDMPKTDKEKLIDKYGATNWYEWRMINWGVKWDAGESGFWMDGKDQMISFQTPWGPPREFMKKLSKQFNKVTFVMQYADECVGSPPLGESTYINGEEHIRNVDVNKGMPEKFSYAVHDEEWAEFEDGKVYEKGGDM